MRRSVGRVALAGTDLAGQCHGSDAIRVYERLGFTREGRLRDELSWEGERHDAVLMSLFRPEWQAAR